MVNSRMELRLYFIANKKKTSLRKIEVVMEGRTVIGLYYKCCSATLPDVFGAPIR